MPRRPCRRLQGPGTAIGLNPLKPDTLSDDDPRWWPRIGWGPSAVSQFAKCLFLSMEAKDMQ
jgi:hypothetical protein